MKVGQPINYYTKKVIFITFLSSICDKYYFFALKLAN